MGQRETPHEGDRFAEVGKVVLRVLHDRDYDWNAAAKDPRSRLHDDHVWEKLVGPLFVRGMKEIIRQSGNLSEDLPHTDSRPNRRGPSATRSRSPRARRRP